MLYIVVNVIPTTSDLFIVARIVNICFDYANRLSYPVIKIVPSAILFDE